MALFSCKWALPGDVGETDGELHACPDKPNCVSSFSQGNKHVDPLPVNSDYNTKQVMDIARATILAMPGTSLRREKGNYLWFEFKTKLGFVDDVELLYNPENHEIYFRSASRMGYYDFNMNQKRYQTIRDEFRRTLL